MLNGIGLIQDSLEAIGVYQPGETITAADADRGLIVLNDLLEQWSNDNLACFAFLTQSIALQNNVGQYTIGPGGDVNGTRPLQLTQVYLQDALGNASQETAFGGLDAEAPAAHHHQVIAAVGLTRDGRFLGHVVHLNPLTTRFFSG